MALFELFAAEQAPMTVTQIAAAMNMPQSSTSFLLKSMVALGYLDNDIEARTFYPTMRIALLGTWLRRRHTDLGRIPKLIERIAAKTGETALIAMRNGIYAQYLLVQHGPDPLRLQVESGMFRPLTCCAAGWALLSRKSQNEIGKIVRRTQVEAKDAHWRHTATQAIENIEATRRNGYAFSHGETTKGAGAIAILLPTRSGSAELSASVGGPISRIEEQRDLIIDCLNELSREITPKAVEQLVSGKVSA